MDNGKGHCWASQRYGCMVRLLVGCSQNGDGAFAPVPEDRVVAVQGEWAPES